MVFLLVLGYVAKFMAVKIEYIYMCVCMLRVVGLGGTE